MRNEQAQRVAKEQTFPFVWQHRKKLKSEYDISHLNRIKTIIEEHETLTEYDLSKLESYYEKVMNAIYKAGEVKTKHDNTKRLRY